MIAFAQKSTNTPRLYVFADEAGDFAFKRGHNISRYFIVCTVAIQSCQIGNDLLELRRKLAWERVKLGDYFHATTDIQEVRDAVFAVIAKEPISIHATIMEKAKAQPQVCVSKERFYQHGWFYHLKHAGPRFIMPGQELLLTTASIGTKKGQAVFTNAVNDVARQTIRRSQWSTAFWPAQSDPCLQIADYCTWAIQRKWERGDSRSYDLIKHQIGYEFDLWSHGKIHYY